MTATRGGWNVDEAVVSHWKTEGLDEAFRDEWDNSTDTSYFPLNHETAEPEPPGPYAVYTISTPVIVATMSGKTSAEERQLLDYTLTIEVHCKSNSTTSGKIRAWDLAKLVIAAFDPGKVLPVCDDEWVQTRRGPDNSLRLGEEEWAWVCMFTIQIDAAYAR
jgi:hypothetical protein